MLYAENDVVKTNASKVNRSTFYQLINTIVPINHVLRARFDLWGAILVVGLIFAAVSVMKLLELSAQ